MVVGGSNCPEAVVEVDHTMSTAERLLFVEFHAAYRGEAKSQAGEEEHVDVADTSQSCNYEAASRPVMAATHKPPGELADMGDTVAVADAAVAAYVQALEVACMDCFALESSL